MTVIRRHKKEGIPAVVWIFILFVVSIMFLALFSGQMNPQPSRNNTVDPGAVHAATAGLGQQLRRVVESKRQEFRQALKGLTEGNLIITRLKLLREKHEIIGERLIEISQGKETAEEILHGYKQRPQLMMRQRKDGKPNKKKHPKKRVRKINPVPQSNSDKPPMEVKEVSEYLNGWIHQLHETLGQAKHATFENIWKAYHDLTVKTLYPWDQEYLHRMPPRRNDGSIFLSIASYRDEMCNTTLYNAFAKAKYPDQLFVGLVQQNCHENCQSGVLENITTVQVPPDPDCYQLFCQSSDLGKTRCHQVRLLDIDEAESLGPYAARYLASKLWHGESWYMQIDAHMTFAQDWDALCLAMLHDAPSSKPVISHYPLYHTVDLEAKKGKPSSRLCGPVFANTDLESQIIRLEGSGIYDPKYLKIPPFAPFAAAGFLIAHSSMLKEVPFDPFLPWIFMGEEIIMSSRLWTSGYDIFSPTTSVVGHWYVRRHKPKFWESVHRAFTFGVHTPLQMMILDRIKYQLGYPESALDMLPDRSIVTAVDSYSMGIKRSLKRFLKIVGLDMVTKQVTQTEWCEKGYPPPGFEQFDHLYPDGVALKTKSSFKIVDDDSWELDEDEEEEE